MHRRATIQKHAIWSILLCVWIGTMLPAQTAQPGATTGNRIELGRLADGDVRLPALRRRTEERLRLRAHRRRQDVLERGVRIYEGSRMAALREGEPAIVETAGGAVRAAQVVLTHGAGGSHAAWFQQVPVLADAGYRVVTWDSRGFGCSTFASGTLGTAAAVADLVAILDATGIERAAGNIQAANAIDLDAGQAAGLAPAMLDRLTLVVEVGLLQEAAQPSHRRAQQWYNHTPSWSQRPNDRR